MKVQEIKTMAAEMGIKAGRLKKADLVREIQRHEGNNICFGTEQVHHCNQEGCLWRADCVVEAKKG